MSNLNKSRESYSIKEISWKQAQTALRHIRQQVFVIEQQVPAALEWDGLDEHAIHLLAQDSEGNAIGCARILAGSSIGRMAVIKDWRGRGVGHALLQAALACCRARNWLQVSLSAQTHALTFYQQAGFKICSEEYLDAGIPHRDMKLELTN